MNKPIKSIIIVGGGSAGWITAGRIAACHQNNPELQITLVESPSIGTIRVGEGTWPTMRSTLMKIGISETDFMRECDASFKQGAKFAKWHTGHDDDFYYHPLMLPQGFQKGELASQWQASFANGGSNQMSFSETVCHQEAICEQGLAPKLITTPEYASVVNYAYHLDAGKFAEFLKKHCITNLGIKHVLADVTGVIPADNDDIKAIETKQSGQLEADLFVDCSGFASLLLGQHYQVPFVDCNDVLFVDNALAVQVPYAKQDSPVASHTISTGQDAGWIWDIGLTSRRGVGYVYSSRHTSEAQAEQTLHNYVGSAMKDLTVKKIPIRPGHRQLFWKNNCVAVGLSAGFLEPLEASALVLVELSAEMIAEQLPVCREVMDITAKRFNETFLYRWQRIIDFLKLHYVLTERPEPFWQDNKMLETIPESLQELMKLWQYRSPGDQDFTSNNEVFPAASYQYVLYGMGFKTDYRWKNYSVAEQQFAQQQFEASDRSKQKALTALPKNRLLLNKIQQYGFASI